MKKYRQIWGGLLIGTANGLFGGGGGMLAVPLLERGGFPPKRAHATAIAVIAPVSFVSGLLYAFQGFAPLSVLLPTALGVTLGGFLGAKLLGRMSGRGLSVLFALLMLAAGARMLFS